MSKAIAFWILMLLWLVAGGYTMNRDNWWTAFPGLIIFLAVALLGWAVFGDAIK